MANSLNEAIPSLIGSFQRVTREHLGFIPAVSQDFDDKEAALGDSVKIPVGGAITGHDITPSNTSPQGSSVTPTSLSHTLDKGRAFDFHLTGEEQRALKAGVAGFQNNRMDQAIRSLINEIEVDVSLEAAYASRAAGTAGTTPFASNADAMSAVGRILNDNGAPMVGRKLVVDAAGLQNLQDLNLLLQVNTAGNEDMLRRGVVGQLKGFDVHYSHAVNSHTKGTGTGYLIDNASVAVGDTTITVDTGAGTIVAGDVVTFVGDTNQYVVKTALTGGVTFVIGAPGLKVALADNAAVTVVASAVQNMGFHTEAIALSVRPPAIEGDDMGEHVTITDPMSGLSVQFSTYKQYRQNTFEVSAVWGVTTVKPNDCAILLG